MAIITISRGSFSAGKLVAEKLAERLQMPIVSREELLRRASEEYGISEHELTSALNDSPPFWQQVLGKRLAYVKCITAVLLDHARGGSLIYHGYVGHLLLSGIGQVLRVRIIADMESRIRAAMTQANLNRDQAIAQIHRVDKDRGRWARMLYGVEWDDPNLYDAVLNLAHLSVDGAAQIVAAMAQLDEFKPTAESARRIEDLSLSCRVWAAMAKDPHTRAAGLRVTANAGQVLIAGSVASSKAIDAIPRIAQQVEGVKSLQCDVAVGADWHW